MVNLALVIFKHNIDDDMEVFFAGLPSSSFIQMQEKHKSSVLEEPNF